MPQISKAWYNELQFQLPACIYKKKKKIYKKHAFDAKFAGNVSLWLHFVSNKISVSFPFVW